MNRKILIIVLALLLGAGIPFSGSAIELLSLQKETEDFSAEMARVLPFNASLGLNWSDAYIGKFFPSLPPHFGAGVSLGFTAFKLDALGDIAGTLGFNFPSDMKTMILPSYTVEARIGGVFLPFDAGLKVGYLPPIDLDVFVAKMFLDYLLVGGEIRYAVFDKPILPKVSVGAGFSYIKGSVGAEVSTISLTEGSSTIEITEPRLGIEWDAKVLDFNAQASMSLIIVTPYLGVGVSYAWSNAGYSLEGNVIGNTNAINLDKVDITANGVSSIIENRDWTFRAFGGASLNLTIFKIDLTLLYDFRNTNIGGNLGFRVQI